jgi:RNase H-like domain found in reverse transcriptase
LGFTQEPKNTLKHLRCFFDFVRKFLLNNRKKIQPLQKLFTNVKGERIYWNTEAEQPFIRIKKNFSQNKKLYPHNITKPRIIVGDASYVATGVLLLQHETNETKIDTVPALYTTTKDTLRPLRCYSHSMQPAEKNYPAFKKENP